MLITELGTGGCYLFIPSFVHIHSLFTTRKVAGGWMPTDHTLDASSVHVNLDAKGRQGEMRRCLDVFRSRFTFSRFR